MEKIGIGIIGTGFARRVQIPAFLRCDGVSIVSVASGTESNARATAEEFGIAHFTADWKSTVDHPEVDLVCITTPPQTHREMVLRALSNRKHVVAEKPMAMNLSEAEEMTAAAENAGVLAIIDHELRFLAGRRKAYEMIRSGEIGKVRHAKCNFRAPHRGDPGSPWNWWSDRGQGGGALGAIGSHSIDSLHWFLDADVESVYCRLQTHLKKRKDSSGVLRDVTSDDEANLILKFKDAEFLEDATATIAVSMTEYPQYQNRVEFFGTKGAIRIEARGELFVGDNEAGSWKSVEVELGENLPGLPDTGFARGFVNLAPLIVDTVRKGGTSIEHAATFRDGARVQAVIDAAQRSNDTGRESRL